MIAPNTTPPFHCPAVSVIVPMFNAEKYIAECLDSLLAQTFQNFEVIVVDDCSTDLSAVIVESYRERFNGRLTLSHTETNSGSGALPRNKGMTLSRGEYIAFLDNDDMFTKTALEELYALAKNFDADVVYCEKHYKVNDDGTGIHIGKGADQNVKLVDTPTFESNDLTERFQKILQGKYRVPQWRKFVRRSLILEQELFFPQTRHADDVIWTWALVLYAKRFLRVPNVTYIYRLSKSSIMRTKKSPQQKINFDQNPLLLGIKTLDKFLGKLEFFRRNPQYHYAILENFVNSRFSPIIEASTQLPPFVIYETLKNEFGDKLGEHDVLICALCTVLNTQQKINVANVQQFNQFAAHAQEQVNKFNQFAAAANNRIAELETEVKRLQS